MIVPNDIQHLFNPDASLQPTQSQRDDDDFDLAQQHQYYDNSFSVAAVVERIFGFVVYMDRGRFMDHPNPNTTNTTTPNLSHGIESTSPTTGITASTAIKYADALTKISQNVLLCLLSVVNYSEDFPREEVDISSDTASSKEEKQILVRVHHWIQCICKITSQLSSTDESEVDGIEKTCLNGITAVVLLVTIFLEVPSARTIVAQTILEMLSQCTTVSSDYKGHATRTIYTTVITLILSSSPLSDSQGDDGQHHSTLDNTTAFLDLDIISCLLKEPIPLTCFCDIARSISPLPSARSILLLTRPKDYTRPEHEAIRCRLYSLIILMQRTRWKDYEIEAWSIFSDILVDNGLDLPMAVRVWMLQELKDGVRNMRFHRDIIKKLLRACIVRLIHFLVNAKVKQQTSSNKMRMKRNEKSDEVIDLFDLVFTLLHSDNVDCTGCYAQHKTSSLVLQRCLNLLPTQINWREYQVDIGADDETTLSDKVSKLSNEAVASEFLCVASFCCLIGAFNTIADKAFIFDGITLPSLFEIKMKLVEEEHRELGEYPSTGSLPIWVQNCEFSYESMTDQNECKQLSKPIARSLCDIVALLCTGPLAWVSNAIDFQEGSNTNRLAFQLTPILCLQQQISESIDDGAESRLCSSLEVDALMRSFVCFSTTVVPIMKQNIVNRVNIPQTNDMLSVTLDLCERYTVKCDETSAVVSIAQYLKCFSNIYSAVAQDDAAGALICYLEACCSKGKVVIHNVSMESPEEIECFVRRLRSSFFQCLSYRLAETHYIDSFCYNAIRFDKYDVANVCPLESFTTYINCIAKDLTSGLNGGKSGGLTHDLYMSMIETVERCAQLASYLLTSKYYFQKLSVASLPVTVLSASKAFEEILCNFAIPQAISFKKTLILCTATLPSVMRLVRYHDFSVIDEYNEDAVSCTRRIFDQLICILRRKCELLHLEMKPWEIIAGKDHLGGRLHYFDSDDDVSELSDGFTDEAKYEKESKVVERSNKSAAKILLRSERSWTWSLCCIMDAFKQDWLDAKVFMANNSSYGLETNVEVYFEIRHAEFKESLAAVHQLFQSSAVSIRTQGHPVSICPDYVYYLPTPAKLKLCSMVDTVVGVLKKSIKILLSLVHSIADVRGQYLLSRSNMEAFICLHTWLSLCIDRSELSCALHRWQLTEKGMIVCADNEKSADRSSLLRQLPILFNRCEEVESLLQKLSYSICTYNKKKKNRKPNQPFIEEINKFIADVIDDSVRFDVLVSRKVAFIENEHSILQKEFGLLDTDKDSKGKKRKNVDVLTKVIRRERRRRIIRSRNCVVDKWLQSDRITGEEDPIDEDAYEDLEDFLVDG
jgi:hypothetical protein